jgi:hypothetical protein
MSVKSYIVYGIIWSVLMAIMVTFPLWMALFFGE